MREDFEILQAKMNNVKADERFGATSGQKSPKERKYHQTRRAARRPQKMQGNKGQQTNFQTDSKSRSRRLALLRFTKRTYHQIINKYMLKNVNCDLQKFLAWPFSIDELCIDQDVYRFNQWRISKQDSDFGLFGEVRGVRSSKFLGGSFQLYRTDRT